MLTPSQLQTLKTAINADPALAAQPNNSDGAFYIAAALNQAASPAWVVWRTAVSIDEIMLNGFDWTRVDNLSVGKARIWDWMTRFGTINPTKANIRAGIEATWVGTAADLSVRAAVYVHCKVNATKAQKLFSSGTGSDATPASMDSNIDESFQLQYADVELARNS
jgi:hypothetical protein